MTNRPQFASPRRVAISLLALAAVAVGLRFAFAQGPAGAEVGQAEIAKRRAAIDALSLTEKQELRRRYERFRKLSPQEQERIRTMHAEISADEQAESLFATLKKYQDWITSRSSLERDELRAMPAEERLARIERTYDRERDRRPFGYNQADALAMLEWAKTWISQDEERMRHVFRFTESQIHPELDPFRKRPEGRFGFPEIDEEKLAALDEAIQPKLEKKEVSDSHVLGWLQMTRWGRGPRPRFGPGGPPGARDGFERDEDFGDRDDHGPDDRPWERGRGRGDRRREFSGSDFRETLIEIQRKLTPPSEAFDVLLGMNGLLSNDAALQLSDVQDEHEQLEVLRRWLEAYLKDSGEFVNDLRAGRVSESELRSFVAQLDVVTKARLLALPLDELMDEVMAMQDAEMLQMLERPEAGPGGPPPGAGGPPRGGPGFRGPGGRGPDLGGPGADRSRRGPPPPEGRPAPPPRDQNGDPSDNR